MKIPFLPVLKRSVLEQRQDRLALFEQRYQPLAGEQIGHGLIVENPQHWTRRVDDAERDIQFRQEGFAQLRGHAEVQLGDARVKQKVGWLEQVRRDAQINAAFYGVGGWQPDIGFRPFP